MQKPCAGRLYRWMIYPLITCLIACTTLIPIAPRYDAVHDKVHSGDKVQVVTRDGQTRTFVVTDVTETGLAGEGVTVDFGQTESLQVQKISAGKTVGCLLVGVGVLILLGVLLIQSQGLDMDLSGPGNINLM